MRAQAWSVDIERKIKHLVSQPTLGATKISENLKSDSKKFVSDQRESQSFIFRVVTDRAGWVRR
jgi:hypothetical protein